MKPTPTSVWRPSCRKEGLGERERWVFRGEPAPTQVACSSPVPALPLCTSVAFDLMEAGGLMSYGELVIALFVVAVLFIAFTYEDPRDTRN